MIRELVINTDTATVTVFDLAAIKHRISDAPDWWSIASDEIQEVNSGNIAFLGLGQDGSYKVNIVNDIDEDFGTVYLQFPSGQVFVGAGEDTTGGDLEPDSSDVVQGEVISFHPGHYMMKFKKIDNVLELAFHPSENNNNNLQEPIRL